jgi:hypothetical protein
LVSAGSNTGFVACVAAVRATGLDTSSGGGGGGGCSSLDRLNVASAASTRESASECMQEVIIRTHTISVARAIVVR